MSKLKNFCVAFIVGLLICTTESASIAAPLIDKTSTDFITNDGKLSESEYDIIKNKAAKYVYTKDTRVNQIEKLIYDRNELIIKINDNPGLSLNEKKMLENDLKKVNNELKKLGVMDGVPDEIKRVETTEQVNTPITARTVYPTSYFDFYSSVLDISSWEASYTYNGVSYRTCTVTLQEPANSMNYLSKIYNPNVVVKGTLTNLSQVNQYLLSGLKMVAKKANSYNPFVQARIAINALVSLIPNVQPQYLITGSGVVHHIPTVRKHEFIRYIYVYDADVDEWRLCGAGNYAYCIIANDIYTKPGSTIIRNPIDKTQYFYGTYDTIRQESVYWFAAQKQAGISAAPIDGVLKNIDIDYEEGSTSMRILSINLAADQYPGLINLY